MPGVEPHIVNLQMQELQYLILPNHLPTQLHRSVVSLTSVYNLKYLIVSQMMLELTKYL